MGDVFDSILVQTAQILAKGVSGSANQMGIRSQVLTVIDSIKCRQLNLRQKREYKTDTRAAIGESTVYARPWTGPQGQKLSELYWLRIEGVVYDITSVVVERDLVGAPHHLTITIEEIVGSVPTVVTPDPPEVDIMQSASVTLTADQIKALTTYTGVLLVAAPGAGKLLVPVQAIFQLKFGTVNYDVPDPISDYLLIGYGPADNVAVPVISTNNDNGGAGVLTYVSSRIAIAEVNSDVATAVNSAIGKFQAEVENQPLCLAFKSAGSPTNGDGTLRVTVLYTTVTLI